MSHATAIFTGTLVRIKSETDEKDKEYLKGLLIVEEGQPGVIVEVYGKAMDEFVNLKDSPIVVVGSARLAESKQPGLKQDLVVSVRQFAIADGKINNLDITGTLGKDPEIRSTNSGKSIANFSLAVNTWPHKEASWFEIDAWEKDAETICNYCQKGHALSIPFATAKIDEWKKDGETHKKWRFTAQRIDLHSRKENEGNGNGNGQRSVSQVTKAVNEKHGEVNLDEVPF